MLWWYIPGGGPSTMTPVTAWAAVGAAKSAANARARNARLNLKCLRIILVLLPLLDDGERIPPSGNAAATADPPAPIT